MPRSSRKLFKAINAHTMWALRQMRTLAGYGAEKRDTDWTDIECRTFPRQDGWSPGGIDGCQPG